MFIIKSLATVSQLRGTDSTGLFAAIHDNKRALSTHYKAAESATEFLRNPNTMNILSHQDVFMIAGHNRSATIGEISCDNAHPFKEGHIMGEHNGHIPEMQGTINGIVVPDSRVLFKKLSEVGPDAALRQADSGAYAVVYLNAKDGTLNFSRNDKRTLYFMETQDALFWASEWQFLDLVKNRDGSSITKYKPIQTLKPYSLLSYNLLSLSKTERDLEKKVVPPSSVPFIPRATPKEESKVATIKRKPGYYGYKGKNMNIKKAKQLISKGCAFNRDHHLTIDDSVHWINNKDCLCEECATNKAVLSFMGVSRSWEGVYEKGNK